MGRAQSSNEAELGRLLRRAESSMRRVAARRSLWICASLLLPVLIRIALLSVIPLPQPAIQDEFSYLLAGDTFASGRLTNAPHPFWVFFESIHILQQPTYMSKYPPLMGLLLALGQFVLGQPWAGVLLSMGVLCAALCWALQQWLPPPWALVGTAIAILKIGILSYWSESYWGGTGAAIGGTLLLGSVPRMIRAPTFRNGCPAVLGAVLLLMSRPFEGAVLTALCLSYVGWNVLSRSTLVSSGMRDLALGLAVPFAALLIPAAAWSSYYNYRVTENPLVMPYMAHERQYAIASTFFWQDFRPIPVYRHEALRQSWVEWDLRWKTYQRQHIAFTRWIAYNRVNRFFWGVPLLALVLWRARWIARSRRLRPALWIGILFLSVLGLESDLLPHYAAPATALAYLLVAAALRSVHLARTRDIRWGRVVFPCALMFLVALLSAELLSPSHRFLFDKRDFQQRRAQVLNYLGRIPAKHLVFVQYGPNHDLNHEWVYNRADFDGSSIIWARSMGPEADRSLLRYYQDRRAWLLDEDGGTPRIIPYSNTSLRAGR